MEKLEIKENNFDFSNLSERGVTDMIVLHHTGGNVDASAEQIHGWHKNQGWAGIGYHFVIRKDGTIERGRPEWAVGSHAYGENSHTIGIHLSGNFTEEKPTTEQVENCAELIADICKRYEIPIDREHIVGHGELMPTGCPGENLQALLNDGTITGKANFYLNEMNGIPQETANNAEGESVMEKRYNTVEELPEWAKPTIERLIEHDILKGDGTSLDLSADMLRTFVVVERMLQR